ncbi:molybdate ABC transporter substrate-binding protein [Salmonella enterica subsp. enterica serovar Senftenberg]|nr:molybdate ABC transporter substrate-binding protein [Salmonella enterica subsp. enterica serovar Senftenberg]
MVSSFASSSTLARQIEAGAPADLFISADQKWMDYAADKKRWIPRRAKHCLAIAGGGGAESQRAEAVYHRQQNGLDSSAERRTSGGGRSATRTGGIYAKEALQSWAHGKRLNRNWRRARMCAARWRWSNVTKRLWALYTVLMRSPARVNVVATFPKIHIKVEYPIAIVEGHKNATVSAFYDYLKGPQASAIFKRYGFTTK